MTGGSGSPDNQWPGKQVFLGAGDRWNPVSSSRLFKSAVLSDLDVWKLEVSSILRVSVSIVSN